MQTCLPHQQTEVLAVIPTPQARMRAPSRKRLCTSQLRTADVPLYPFFGKERLLVFTHEYPAGSLQHNHCHDVPQLLHAVRGVMRMTTPAGHWVVPPGRGVWIPAFMPHEIRMVEQVSMRTLYVGSPESVAQKTECSVVDVSPYLSQLFDQLSGAEAPDAMERPRRFAIEDLVLLEIQRMKEYRLHLPLPSDIRLRRLCDHLLSHLDQVRTLEDLSLIAAASTRTLRRLFQQELGMSFAAWRMQARLLDALARLGVGQPISEISRELGYATPSAFIAMFRRTLGQTPKRYSRLQQVEA